MKGDLPVRASASDIAGFRLLGMGGEPVGVDSQPAPRESECTSLPPSGAEARRPMMLTVRTTGNIVVQAAKSSCDILRSENLLLRLAHPRP